MAVSLTPIGLHPLAYKQKFTFEISAGDWDSDGDICLGLLSVPGTMPGGSSNFWLKKRESTRALFFTAEFLHYKNFKVKEDIFDETHVHITLLKNSEFKFASYIDFIRGTLIPDPRELDLFNEEGKFTLEAIVYVTSSMKDLGKQANGYHECRMLDVMNHQESSDVKIVCKGVEFKCHRCILISTCSAFKAMLKGETAENLTNIISIEDSTPESVELMIEFLYTGVIPGIPAAVEMDLFKLANKYSHELRPLATACIYSIIENLTVENFLPTYAEIDMHGQLFPEFKVKAMQFFKKNGEQIARRDDYLKFCREFTKLSQELMVEMVASYKEIDMEEN